MHHRSAVLTANSAFGSPNDEIAEGADGLRDVAQAMGATGAQNDHRAQCEVADETDRTQQGDFDHRNSFWLLTHLSLER